MFEEKKIPWHVWVLPCNSGKTTEYTKIVEREGLTIFLSPTKVLNRETTYKFRDAGYRVYNTSRFNEYVMASHKEKLYNDDLKDVGNYTNYPLAEANVACLTYDSFLIRFAEDRFHELAGATIICDEGHRLQNPDNIDEYNFLDNCRKIAKRIEISSATWDQYSKSVVGTDIKVTPFDNVIRINRTTGRIQSYKEEHGCPPPAAKDFSDIVEYNLKTSELMSLISKDREIHRVALPSIKGINNFYRSMPHKNILVICSGDAQLKLINKLNLPDINIYKGGDLKEVILEQGIDLILHTNAMEDGNNIELPHISWFVGKGGRGNQTISQSSVIQSVNRCRNTTGIKDPYRFISGGNFKLSKEDKQRIAQGPWYQKDPFNVFSFQYSTICDIIKYNPPVFQPIVDYVNGLKWCPRELGWLVRPDGKKKGKKRTIKDIIDGDTFLIRNNYILHNQLYFDEKEYKTDSREYNDLIQKNSYERYNITNQVEKDSPYVSLEYDMTAGYATIFLNYCGRVDKIPEFLETRKLWNIKSAANNLLNFEGYNSAIENPYTKAYYDHVGITKSMSWPNKLARFFNIEVTDIHPDILKFAHVSTNYKTRGRAVYYFFTTLEKQIVNSFISHVKNEILRDIENPLYYFSRQHDGVRIWVKKEYLEYFEESYKINDYIFHRVDYIDEELKGWQRGLDKGEDRTLEYNSNFFNLKTSRKGKAVGKAVSKTTAQKRGIVIDINAYLKDRHLELNKENILNALSKIGPKHNNAYVETDYRKLYKAIKQIY